MKNTRGLSQIVTTLIIILLVLMSIAIIRPFIIKLVNSSSNKLGSATECIDIQLNAIKVIPTNNATSFNGDYNVTLKRNSGGEGNFGAKLVFTNNNGDSSGVVDFVDMLNPLRRITKVINGTIGNATEVQVTPYYKDADSGKTVLCSSPTTFKFSN